MLKKHPVLRESESFKQRYIQFLEYFVRKFSALDEWANETLRLYKNALLQNRQGYMYGFDFEYPKKARAAVATRFKPFQIFSYRYCAVVDCVFMNALDDETKGERICLELAEICPRYSRAKVRRLCDALYDSELPLDEFDQIDYLADCWRRNRAFLREKPIRVIVTATMSAGKSTLLNALVGRKLNRTSNAACTAKIHCIKNKPYDDGYCYKNDYALNLNATPQELINDDKRNGGEEIEVATFFQTGENRKVPRVCLIDTPGVNSSQNPEHRRITERCIREANADLMIFLLDCRYFGTNDEKEHLRFVLKHYRGKIIFIVNQLDRFKRREDSVPQTLAGVVDYLKKIGFKKPFVAPLSAYAAYLAKNILGGQLLDEEEQGDYEGLVRKLKQDEYRFDAYYPDYVSGDGFEDKTECYRLLVRSGIVRLEELIYGKKG